MERKTQGLVLIAAYLRIGLPVLAAALIFGCKTTKVEYSSARPMPPDPRPAKAVPSSARANTMALMVEGKPTDTDGNGYPDMIVANMYLFSLPYSSPMFEDGTFVFSLRYHDDQSRQEFTYIAEWKLNASELERGRNLYGPVHVARLSLLESGSDRFPAISANLLCRFEPADGGKAVKPTGVHWVQLGRVRPASR